MDTTKTFRGRTLEDVLPQVRTELGPDAIVLRRREGLAGGIAGFFQRSYVEVDASAPSPEVRTDRATAEGLATPAVQALVQQAAPFADALLDATARDNAAPAGLYGPQPNFAELAPDEPAAEALPAAAVAPPATASHPITPARSTEPASSADAVAPARSTEPASSADAVAPARSPEPPAAAAALEAALVTAGLSAELATDVVGEAVAHGLPFSSPRRLKTLGRATLARRIPVPAAIGPGPRRIAFVGAGGAGKSAAIAALARAYAAADAEVVVVALRSPDGGCGLAAELEPHGVSVIAAADAAQAGRRLARRRPLLELIDTPAAGPADRSAITALAADLKALGAGEVHLALPATMSAAAADELAGALAPLGITHVALTHSDQTARPGAPVELAMTAGKPLSYVCGREAAEPVDAAGLAQLLLP